VSVELPGDVVFVLNEMGLPWPGINEDELRAWAQSVRNFANDMSDSSARTRQTASGLADSSQSSFLNGLAEYWDQHHQLVADLHGPLDVFAGALDAAADLVEAQKYAVITVAGALIAEGVISTVGAVLTLGLSEAANLAAIAAARKVVQAALDYLAAKLLSDLVDVGMREVNDHANSFVANLLNGTMHVGMEIQSLKMSYNIISEAASTVRGHSTETDSVGDTAYRENLSRDIEDNRGHGYHAALAAAIQAVEQGLRDIARTVFQVISEAIAKAQAFISRALDDFSARIEAEDEKLGADVPPEDNPVTGVNPSLGSAPPRTGDGVHLTDEELAANDTASQSADVVQLTDKRVAATDAASRDVGVENALNNGVTAGDPVDVATGDVVAAEADVTLPGVLPLVITRSHRSSRRTGRWFGPSWVSSLDQRLQVSAERVIGVFDDGRLLTWARPVAAGGVAAVPASGPAWRLRRDADGSYTVTDPQRGLTWRFEPRAGYELDQAGEGELPLVALADRVGHEIALAYGPAGEPTAVTHSGGYRVLVTTAGGHVTHLRLAGRNGEPDITLRRFTYDGHGNLSGVVNSSDKPLRYRYDGDGRLTGWDDRNGHYYRYAYDRDGRCVSGEGPGGALSGTFTYEPGITRWTTVAGAATAYEITESALVFAITGPLGDTARREHDERGRVTTAIDPLGRITRCAYDGDGNLIAVTRPDGSQATAQYDEHGLLTSLTGTDGATWRQEHDARGNRTALVAPDGAVTRFGYDASGHLASITDPAGAVTRVASDAAGLPVAVTSPAGGLTRFTRNPLGLATEVTAPDGAVTGLAWTVEGWLTERTFPDNATESWTYDGEGNLTSQVDAAASAIAYEYGPFGRLAAIASPDGTHTELDYDDELRLTSVVHAGLPWRYQYDAAGRLTAETDYNAATSSYAYDPAGQLTGRVNAVGQQVTYRYDEAGRQTERAADGVVTTFAYDVAGRLAHASNPGADVRFELDALGRVTAETCNGRTVTSAYNPAGRLVRRVTPSGSVTTWEYDPDGRPLAMTADGHQVRFGYDPAGRETRRDLPGGLTLTQDWDQRGRLTLQELTGSAAQRPEGPSVSAPGQVLQRRSYRYRPDGLVTGIDDLLAGDRAIGLDRAGRVTSVAGQDWVERYAYDPAGNLTSASWPAPSPSGPVPHSASPWLDTEAQGPREVTGSLIIRAGSIRYRHDGQGRVTQRQRSRISRKPDTWRYEWDADDRLVSATTPDGSTWRYAYDPFGRRIAKERLSAAGDVAERTDFTWDGAFLVEQTATGPAVDQRDVVTWNYRQGTFTPVTQAERTLLRDAPQDEIDQRFYGIVTDLVGTPTELTSLDGTVAGHQVQTLWGGTTWTSDGAQTPLRFPGQYEDSETGLHYNNQRYYDPVSASYLTPDPLGLAPAPNPHAYVPNPQVLADPLGLCTNTAEGAGEAFKTVYRFHDASDPTSLLSRLASAQPDVQAKVASQLQSPAEAARLAEAHMQGFVENSPFVSVTDNPTAAAATTDPWLRNIAARAPNLSEFRVPVSRLIAPSNPLSVSEGEYVFQGDDLINYLVQTRANRFGGG
jgi:RHS repeat-associated protein